MTVATLPAEPVRRPLRSMGRALGHRNYRLFFVGQGISLIGTWMTRLATGWLVYQLAGAGQAAFLLGAVGFAGQIPAFLLGPFAGVVIDRHDRYRTLLLTQVLSLVQSALLAVVAFRAGPDSGAIGYLIALSVLQGVINAFDMPARQSLLVEMVEDRGDLPNAIALNSSLVNGARLVGPSLAGVVIAVAGEAWCFVGDAASYVAVVIALLLLRLPKRPRQPRDGRVAEHIREGFAYAFGFRPIRAILLLLAWVSFLGMPYSVLLPVFAEKILHGGPYTLGFLSGAAGLGALTGALFLASRPSVLGLGRIIVLACLLFGAGLCGFALSQSLWLSLLALLVSGFGLMVQMAASNTILQTIVEEDKRGRVMSFYSMAFLGVAPFGSLLAGLLATRYGAPRTVLGCGIGCIGGGLLFAGVLPRLRELVRPIYSRLGIIPEVAAGMGAAAELSRPPHE